MKKVHIKYEKITEAFGNCKVINGKDVKSLVITTPVIDCEGEEYEPTIVVEIVDTKTIRLYLTFKFYVTICCGKCGPWECRHASEDKVYVGGGYDSHVGVYKHITCGDVFLDYPLYDHVFITERDQDGFIYPKRVIYKRHQYRHTTTHLGVFKTRGTHNIHTGFVIDKVKKLLDEMRRYEGRIYNTMHKNW